MTSSYYMKWLCRLCCSRYSVKDSQRFYGNTTKVLLTDKWFTAAECTAFLLKLNRPEVRKSSYFYDNMDPMSCHLIWLEKNWQPLGSSITQFMECVLIFCITTTFITVRTTEFIDKKYTCTFVFYLTLVTFLARHIRCSLDSVSILSEECFIMPETLQRRGHWSVKPQCQTTAPDCKAARTWKL